MCLVRVRLSALTNSDGLSSYRMKKYTVICNEKEKINIEIFAGVLFF